MTQDTFTEKISLWLDNELSPAEVAELKAHLAGCLNCQQNLQAMHRVDTFLKRASSLVASPQPDFTARFEARLVQQQATNGGYWWLGLGVLLLGTVFLFVVGGVLASALISTGINLFGVEILYTWLAGFIELSNSVRVWLNLVGLFVKVSFITMAQPLFWGYVLLAAAMAWLWVRVMKSVYRPVPMKIELLI